MHVQLVFRLMLKKLRLKKKCVACFYSASNVTATTQKILAGDTHLAGRYLWYLLGRFALVQGRTLVCIDGGKWSGLQKLVTRLGGYGPRLGCICFLDVPNKKVTTDILNFYHSVNQQ